MHPHACREFFCFSRQWIISFWPRRSKVFSQSRSTSVVRNEQFSLTDCPQGEKAADLKSLLLLFFQIVHLRQTAREYFREERQRRRNKANQQFERRRKKKKTNLLSSFANSPDSSQHSLVLSDHEDHSADEILQIGSNNDLCSDLRSPVSPSQHAEANETNDRDGFAAIDDNLLSKISTCSSPSKSQDDSIDVVFEELPVEDERDNRFLYPSALNHVEQLSANIIEFSRSARLTENQRNQLVGLFKNYLPSPSLVSTSGSNLLSTFRNDLSCFLGLWPFFRVDSRESAERDISVPLLSFEPCENREICCSFAVGKLVSNLHFHLDAIGIEKPHRSQKVCGSCQMPTDDLSRCRTTDCKHQDAKVPPDDLLEIIFFEIVEKLRLSATNIWKFSVDTWTKLETGAQMTNTTSCVVMCINHYWTFTNISSS